MLVQQELFRTQRTIVRLFRDSDLKALVGIMTDAEVMRFTGFEHRWNKAHIEAFFQV